MAYFPYHFRYQLVSDRGVLIPILYHAYIDGLRNDWKLWHRLPCRNKIRHYNDVTMSPMASQITSLTFVYSTVYSGLDQRKHQSSASLAFVRRIHRGPVNSPQKRPVTRKMFSFDDVIMWGHLLMLMIWHYFDITGGVFQGDIHMEEEKLNWVNCAVG